MILEDLLVPVAKDTRNSNSMTYHQLMWRENGFIILDDLIPHAVMDAYSKVREKAVNWEWMATPYMIVPELKELCCHPALAAVLEEIIGYPAGLHLNLCNWTTTTRDWHSDYYLVPKTAENSGLYCAVWMALDDIHPDSGPFQFVRGSHKWGRMHFEKILEVMLEKGITTVERISKGDWPIDSEKLLTPLFEDKLKRNEEYKIESFIAKKGQILIWHPDLWHRGSLAKKPGMIRKSVISHYSSIHHRKDFPAAIQHSGGGWFFPIKTELRHPVKR